MSSPPSSSIEPQHAQLLPLPCAKFEPQYDHKGLIIPEPNTGHGYQNQNASQPKYHIPDKSPSNVPVTESNDSTDIEHDDHTGIDDNDIAAGISFVLEAPTYASTSEALEYAFQSAL